MALEQDAGFVPTTPRVEWTGPQDGSRIGIEGRLDRPSDLGLSFYKKVRRMRRDPTVKMAREFAVAPFLASKWSYDADECAPEGLKEMVQKEMDRHRIKLLRQAVLGTLDYGWQSYELIWEDGDDGYWKMCLKPLLPDITDIIVDPKSGRFVGLEQNPLTIGGVSFGWENKVFLSRECCALINIDVEGTGWYGEPVMKALENLYDEQLIIQKSARKYDAKIAGSHWVVYYPLGVSMLNGVSVDNGQIAKELIQSIESVGGIAVPRSVVQIVDKMNLDAAGSEALMWKIELLSDKGQGQAPFLDRFKYIDTLKVRAFGWPERTMLEGQFGTKAEAEAHADLGILNMECKHEAYCEQFNEQFVERFIEYNAGAEYKGCVKIKPAPLADRARATLIEVYKLLLASPEAFAQELMNIDVKALRDRIGVPEAQYVPTYQDDLAQLDGFVDPVADPYAEPTYGEEYADVV